MFKVQCSMLAIALFFLVSCGEEEKPKEEYTNDQLKKILENSNKVKNQREEEDILNFFKRREMKPEKTGTGVYYYVYKKGDEKQKIIQSGNYVKVVFNVSLIDGKLCYSTNETGPLEIMVEKAEVESGLHDVLVHLRKGDKAIVLIPSHRAHGLLGDLEKIPAISTVVYDIEILDVNLK